MKKMARDLKTSFLMQHVMSRKARWQRRRERERGRGRERDREREKREGHTQGEKQQERATPAAVVVTGNMTGLLVNVFSKSQILIILVDTTFEGHERMPVSRSTILLKFRVMLLGSIKRKLSRVLLREQGILSCPLKVLSTKMIRILLFGESADQKASH
jgi:hypothetical protein